VHKICRDVHANHTTCLREEVDAKRKAAHELINAKKRRHNAQIELEASGAVVNKLLTDKKANMERARNTAEAAVHKMMGLISNGAQLKGCHAFCVLLVPLVPVPTGDGQCNMMNGISNAPLDSVRAATVAIDSVVFALHALGAHNKHKALGVTTYELALNVAAKALHIHYFGPIRPISHGKYTYMTFAVCLMTNLLKRDLTVYAQSLGPQSKQDPTKYALVMAEAPIGMVGEVFELRDAAQFHRRWVESTSPAPFGQCSIHWRHYCL
jgi:hypothetical protein